MFLSLGAIFSRTGFYDERRVSFLHKLSQFSFYFSYLCMNNFFYWNNINMFSAHFFNFYSQRPKNWDLKKILKKWFNFSPWFFFSLLAMTFSSNRQCFMAFRRYFHHQKSICKECNFYHLCQFFFPMPAVNKHLMLGPKGIPTCSGRPRSPRGPS